jgi:hypothetical protein
MRIVHPKNSSARVVGAALAVAALTAPFVVGAGAAQADPAATVVLDGLMNPRGVAIAANGSVYVAEAGSGGSIPLGSGPEGDLFGGLTGQIRVVNPATGQSQVLVSGLTSAAGQDGSAAIGVSGLATQGSTVYAIMGESSNAIPPAASGPFADTARAQLGRLLMVTPSGSVRTVADVGGFDYAWTATNPVDGTPDAQDANPYGLLATPGTVLVADAGANAITGVPANGRPSEPILVDASPGDFLSDAVPTCIAPNGSGGYWIGTLNGKIRPLTGGNVGDPISLSGDPFITIGGCTSDGNGGLYVTDQAAFFFGQPGGIYHVTSSGVVSTVLAGSFGPGGFFSPSGIALSADGTALYVAVNSIDPTHGQLLKITL